MESEDSLPLLSHLVLRPQWLEQMLALAKPSLWSVCVCVYMYVHVRVSLLMCAHSARAVEASRGYVVLWL